MLSDIDGGPALPVTSFLVTDLVGEFVTVKTERTYCPDPSSGHAPYTEPLDPAIAGQPGVIRAIWINRGRPAYLIHVGSRLIRMDGDMFDLDF